MDFALPFQKGWSTRASPYLFRKDGTVRASPYLFRKDGSETQSRSPSGHADARERPRPPPTVATECAGSLASPVTRKQVHSEDTCQHKTAPKSPCLGAAGGQETASGDELAPTSAEEAGAAAQSGQGPRHSVNAQATAHGWLTHRLVQSQEVDASALSGQELPTSQ